jgi:hypothetical protein
VSGYASTSFTTGDGRVSSKVTIYGTSAMTNSLFGRLQTTYSGSCTVALAAPGRLVSVATLRVDVPLDYARGFTFVARHDGRYWAGRVYILGEGRIAATLLVEQRGRRLTGTAAALPLSLLVSRMED